MPNFYNLLRARKFNTTADTALEIAPYGSATPNFSIDAGGKLRWSSGSATADTTLYRSAANVLKTDDSFDIASGKTYKVDGTDVLSATTLGSSITGSSLTSVGTLSTLSAATASFTGPTIISGRTDIQQIREVVNNITISSGTLTCNYNTGGIFYVDAGVGATTFTVDITNLPTDNNYAVSVTLIVKQGATQGIPTVIKADGSTVTHKWANANAAPTASASTKIDIFTFTLHRVASAWVILGSYSLNY
jgi:hypothetical protein